jgi:hypothetical protein
MVRVFAHAGSLLLTTVLSIVLFGFCVTTSFAVGVSAIVLSVYLYRMTAEERDSVKQCTVYLVSVRPQLAKLASHSSI